MSVAALVLGIIASALSLFAWVAFGFGEIIPMITGVIAIVLGAVGRKKEPEKAIQAQAGLILGIVGLSLAVIIMSMVLLVMPLFITSAFTRTMHPVELPEAIIIERDSRPLESLQYFDGVAQIRGQTADNPPANFMAQVTLGYEKGNNVLTTEINERAARIHNIILLFLSKKTYSELKPENADKLGEQLLREINRVMNSGKIQRVLFKELATFSQ